MDEPPPETLSAFVVDRRISLAHPSFDPDAAEHLEELTRDLLDRLALARRLVPDRLLAAGDHGRGDPAR
jgi:hypothetical protein